MIDLDPRIIKIAKVGVGMLIGAFLVRLVLDALHMDHIWQLLLGLVFGCLAGGGFAVIGIYKKEQEEDDE